MRTPALALACLPWAIACGTPERPGPLDAGPQDVGLMQPVDAGFEDAGTAPDAEPAPQACAPQDLLPFQPVGSLSEGRESHVVAQLDRRLLLLGGWSAQGATRSIDHSDGTNLDQWPRAAQMLPSPREHHGLTVHAAAICIVGGDDGRAISDEVLCADRTSADEISGDWTPAEPLPAPRTGHETVQVGDFVFVMGGVDEIQGASKDTVFRARIGANGRPSGWTQARALPTALTFGAAAASGQRLYYAGGVDGRSALLGVLSASVGPQGDLSAWQQVHELPDYRIGATATVFGQHLWLIGGMGQAGPAHSVWAWPIGADGSLEARTEGPALPEARFGHSTLALQEGLLLVGGWQSTRAPPTVTVMHAPCP